MARNAAYRKAEKKIEEARRSRVTELDLSGMGLTELPPDIWKLTHLKILNLGYEYSGEKNQLTELPEAIGQLTQLQSLNLSYNQLTALPEVIGQLTQLRSLNLSYNQLTALPEAIGQLTQLKSLRVSDNQLTALPESIGQFTELRSLELNNNQLTALPEAIGRLELLESLELLDNQLSILPDSFGRLRKLELLAFGVNEVGNPLRILPEYIRNFKNLRILAIANLHIKTIPEWVGELSQLKELYLNGNDITDLPPSLAQLEHLEELNLDGNPLNPALQSAYEQGLPAVMAYLGSLEDAEPLYESKLVLVGEGGVGKTTLLKALSGRDPRKGEPTTHGVSIDIHSLALPHPEQENVAMQFNGWDFGGQEVYRVTHQFFFSPRAIYLVVWEPRLGVQQCQVEDWLNLIRLRVGDEARVIIVSTHAKTGQRIARIDKPTFQREYGDMIVDFVEVDSLTDDPASGEKFGMAALKASIAQAAKDLQQMGMPFSTHWKAARDQLIELGQTQPRVSYSAFCDVCAQHGLSEIDTRTLATLMHDLGYIVYYADDERLKDDVVLQPEWLTKAIGFVLEDRATQEREGVLPDSHLADVWLHHPFEGEPHYEPPLYPFFLRLMEKYDVAYRLEDGTASLVAQHVPQVAPPLPWQADEEPKPDQRRLAMVCVMDETPPGLIPWMIVRTHDYAFEQQGHRLHWQRGMFLRNKRHGEALLELRGRELHFYAEAKWPEYFMNVLRQTLSTLITDNWPGMQGRYTFDVPCQHRTNGTACQGTFDINALREFLEDGDDTIRCQVCRTRQNIVELLYGFEDDEPREQLARIETKIDRGFADVQHGLDELQSRVANYVMSVLRAIASESKSGPRLFTFEPAGGNWLRPFAKRYELRLWCEAEGCQHPVFVESGKGTYEVKATREWLIRVAPYANFVAGLLKTVLPLAAPAVDVAFGTGTLDQSGWKASLDLMKEGTDKLMREIKPLDRSRMQEGMLSEAERSGILALHSLLREIDPNHERLGLHRVPTYTGDYLWLCQTHYELSQPKIPDTIEA